jgi:hypothetical protein
MRCRRLSAGCGVARAYPEFAQIIANYPNQFADGRRVKGASIGIKDSSGKYVAALYLNIDLTMFHGLQTLMGQFVRTDSAASIKESLDPAGSDAIRASIGQFAARLSITPRSLKTRERRALIQEVKKLWEHGNPPFHGARRAPSGRLADFGVQLREVIAVGLPIRRWALVHASTRCAATKASSALHQRQ